MSDTLYTLSLNKQETMKQQNKLLLEVTTREDDNSRHYDFKVNMNDEEQAKELVYMMISFVQDMIERLDIDELK